MFGQGVRKPILVSRAAGAAAAGVLDHFRRVELREIVVNRDFYPSRIRIGLIAAPVCFAVAGFGFLLKSRGAVIAGGVDPGILIVGGLVFGIGALVLALAASALSRAQLRGR
jgi:hypothetical protein